MKQSMNEWAKWAKKWQSHCSYWEINVTNRETNQSSKWLINNEDATSLNDHTKGANREKQAQIMLKLAQKQVVVGSHSN